MTSDPNAPKLPSDALDAFLDGILVELRDPTDPEALNEVRAAFRRRVPFSLRSYAAAAMILRAAGLSRPTGRPEQRPAKDVQPKGKSGAAPAASPAPKKQSLKAEGKGRRKAEPGESGSRADSPSRPRLAGEGATVFLSMGKRQRLYPRIVIDLIVERAGIGLEEIGEVRAFDNYSFADVAPAKLQAVISALDGYEFRGRKLTVNPAKKREGEAPSD